jgi:PII-like signaling protein
VKVTVVRLYMAESAGLHRPLFEALRTEHQLRGATVFRAMAGFGPSGRVHASDLLELSLDLPVVVEFFETAERAQAVLEALAEGLGERWAEVHVLTFAARLQDPS